MGDLSCCVRSLLAVCMAVLLGSAVPGMTRGESVHYIVTDLGTLPGDVSSYAQAINNSGDVVGYSYGGATGHQTAFLYANGTMTGLGRLPGDVDSSATGINSSRQIVGWSATGASQHAFLYSGGAMTPLGAFPGGDYSVALGINASGAIVGRATGSTNGTTYLHAFLYSNGAMKDLGTLPGDTNSTANAINNSGDVVGYGNHDAFLFNGKTLIDLGALPGDTESRAWALNEKGQVVGDSSTSNASTITAFLYENGAMHSLGVLPGETNSFAFGINNRGEVVGSSDGPNSQEAVLYENGSVIDLNSVTLNDAGWDLALASAINDNGQIVGYGYYNGQQRAFLLSPVPEPSTFVLASIGAAAVVALARRPKEAEGRRQTDRGALPLARDHVTMPRSGDRNV